ncbi:AraC family transcriptional regulator, regulatory protein of adaptative response / methylated-DNA-[protein]-cysteine methyltransferase [Yoonia tamlensis]|uniref:methylated-DNA--[protein]-cysteine S-methyltransferase n=1 Tax=Yoonia tamlensis TaxID=390270 RepID=A0A1I6G730_9RHOB|nr:trifunctional transcriptional activator/DNA repair protein Ada/methylated-DNA--[protein]-cysteine S-methyltransferase [Yoonia tamlensis]SFR37847.1 AraC family transcriptional regulator, regulatory protein of adaptative response / methylated-DNA-[protein]-cysteine methyltransferase [Yoonia tamlensis]
MLMTLPPDDVLYEALVTRDDAYDGRAFVGVSSTGIFCRLTCPARKPKRENCHFYSDVADCIHAGFRPCKRCHPLTPAAQSDPSVTGLLAALDADPMRRWSESDLTRMGLDPSTVRRAFKRHFGMTFLDMARQRRLANGFTTLASGKVIDAQLDAGFDSPAAFRAAFAKLMGTAPGNFAKDALLRAAHIPTPLGDMIAVCDKRALHLLEFADRKALPNALARLRKMVKGEIGIGRTDVTEQVAHELAAFFNGDSAAFTVPLVMHGTPFTRQVWTALRDIPAGQTCSYGTLAQTIGAPTASRAVARANGANQIALIIPCHRVIGADGSLTGYGGGLWRKQKLIDLEKTYAQRTAQ